jgi:UDP-2-acetamido-3-amino-2,3-dideoxy-glucuronate N-acetyltransferase
MTRIAVIGAGQWGLNHVRVFNEVGALGAVCETDSQRASRARNHYPNTPILSSLDQVLKDPNLRAVVIATPAESHYRIARECLLGGKDAFVEKPLALSLPEGQELVRLAAAEKRILMVGHLLQYHPAFVKLTELVRGGELGKIEYIYSNRLNFGKFRVEENILWSFAPHDISMILALLGEMPEEVTAHGASYLNHAIADVTVTNFRFRSGVQAHIFVSWLHPFKEQKLVVVGDRRMAVFNDTGPGEKLLTYGHKVNWVNRVPSAQKAESESVSVEMREPLKEECLHFLECVESRQVPRTDGREGLRVLQVLSACQESLELGGKNILLNS